MIDSLQPVMRRSGHRWPIVVAALAVATAAACGDEPPTTGEPRAAVAGAPPTTIVAPEGVAGVVAWSGLSRNHQQGALRYPMSPPVGGDHAPVWQTCGIYDQAIPDENAVHSLEHGAVWIAYRPDLSADDVAALRAAAAISPFVLMAPYPGLGSKVALSAWERQLVLDDASDPRVGPFIQTYVQGPQTPELGARCTRGAGSPTG